MGTSLFINISLYNLGYIQLSAFSIFMYIFYSVYRTLIWIVGLTMIIISFLFLIVPIILFLAICTGCFGDNSQQGTVHPGGDSTAATHSSKVSTIYRLLNQGQSHLFLL